MSQVQHPTTRLTTRSGTARLASLDAFRGLTIAAMILVNNPGSWSHVYAPLRHAEWHGWTPTDLVFPFFLFIVGTAAVFALARQTASPASIARIARRSAILFGLGLFLAGYPFFTFDPAFGLREGLRTIRIPGVLQRIAVCYFATACVLLTTRPRTQGWLIVLLLLGYWAAMAWIPVPGYGAGQIDGKDTHLAAWIDRAVFGSHLWKQSKTWDPEGLVSTVPAIATCLLGAWTGRLLRGEDDPATKTARLFVRGSVLVLVGYAWSLALPINKPLWTSSYAVFTAGLAMCVLGLCYWSIDVRGRRAWAQVFVVYGVNALTVFVMSGLLAKTLVLIRVPAGAGAEGWISLRGWVYREGFAWLPPFPASLAWGLCWVLGWLAVLGVMYRRGWIIRV